MNFDAPSPDMPSSPGLSEPAAAPTGSPDMGRIASLVASVQEMLDELKGMLPEAAKEEQGDLEEGELDAEAEGEAAQAPGPKAGAASPEDTDMERELLMKSLRSV